MKRAFVLATIGLLVLSAAAFGQAQRGSVTVSVTDADGGVLPGATVSATSDQSLTRRTALSDEQGRASLVSLDPATNYVVSVTLDGFAGARIENVTVRAGQDTPLSVQLTLAEISEELIVTAESPLVDVTKTQAGQDITLQLTESLPTARTYQDYLQLVPGVQDSIDTEGNPASRSGINYKDDERNGSVGRSTDNFYYFDGINVTDRTDGTFGANINTEIIQEQSVLTGAIPAEFVGAPGLISNVVTKSGGNQFSGSINYYTQTDSFVESNDHFPDAGFSTFDTAITLGGPIWKDKAWFYGSYRILEREDDVVANDGTFLRTVDNNADQAFGKISWSITDSDLFTAVFLSDPTDISGQRDNTIANEEDFARERGGERFSVGYNRVWGSAALEIGYTDHEGDLNDTPIIRESANAVSFDKADPVPGVEALGGAGEDEFVTRGNELLRGSFEYLFDTSWGDHSLKVGYETGESTLFEDETFIGDPPADWVSISSRYLGRNVTLREVETGFTLQEFGTAEDEFNGFRSFLTSSQMQTLLDLWDDNNDDFLSNDEISANMSFNTTAGNPNGQINYARDLQTTAGSQTESSEFYQAFVQDGWQWNKWSVNAGVRIEQWEHFASTGASIIKFDTDVSPRISVSYDVRGDGRSSIGAFYGRYYDAVRNNMTDFAGSLSGRSIDEQVYVDALGEWVTFRIRGGTVQQDGFFAPAIVSPYTDEFQLQYKQDLGNNMAIEINLIDRETSDIMEDYGLAYFDIDSYGGDPNVPNALFLGPEFLGFTGGLPAANFFIANLPDEAFRDWQGLELVFRKRYSDNWQLLASYNYADADGNSNSDSNADGAGDVFFLDPRAPGRTNTQPGLVEHLFKVSGSYNWDNGIQVGGNYRWNSGVIVNRSEAILFNRHIPDRVDTAFEFGGLTQRWIENDAVGGIDGSSYGVLDARVSYLWNINDRLQADFFLDIFNLLDDQQLIRLQDVDTEGTINGFRYLEGINFVDPRRYFIGARLRF